MAHLPRFHRRKKDVTPPTLITSDLPGKATPSSSDIPPSSPRRSLQKLSPFRVFHRSSGKRARDSPPASLPHSPAGAPVLPPGYADGRPVSPLSLKMEPTSDEAPQKTVKQPKMPAFLDLSDEEILNRFSELVWRERNRLMLSITNPSPDFRWARVTGPHLKTLDRYFNIQPWHNNRIKLRVPEGHIDYVNASPIVLEPLPSPAADGRPGAIREEPDRYIAMQGPKQASMDHVWRMLVEQLESPGVVIMLTETHEGPQEKCFPYFPRSKDDPPLEVNERDEFGDGFRATVRCEGIEETPAGDAIELRKLVIRVHSRTTKTGPVQPTPGSSEPSPQAAVIDVNMTSSMDQQQERGGERQSDSSEKDCGYQEKTLYHFLYKKWPDFGVPSLDDLESFFTLMRLSRERNASPRNPRVVHCSAGVGRSGTFIALEHLMRELDAGVLENWDDREPVGSGGEGGFQEDNDTDEGENEEEEEEEDDDDIDDEAGSRRRRRKKSSDSETDTLEQSRMQGPGAGDLIFETVNSLREQRRTMVQAESQYLFIYRVLRQLWIEKYGSPEAGDGAAAVGGERMEGLMLGQDAGDGDGERAAKRLEVDPSAGRE
ncbi:protein-tyrosine phosphatase-like protein [Corynascus similis CBS 632.67]